MVFNDPTLAHHEDRRNKLTASVAAVLMLCMAAAMGMVPPSLNLAPKGAIQQESLRPPDMREQLEKLTDADATYVREAAVQRGDTIASLLKRLGVEDADAQDFIRNNAAARKLLSLEPGQAVLAEVNQDNLLVSLRVTLNGNVSASRELVIERAGGPDDPAFEANVHALRNELRYEMRSGMIAAGGFFRTLDAANVPDQIVQQMLAIFSGVIDFHHDIVAGDRFCIVYEAGFRDGTLVRNGRVVAVELINRGQPYQAIWYPDEGSNAGAYYTFDGRSMARPFLRSPVEFSRMSSGFGWRIHPRHHRWAQHKGIDFAAPTGAKVLATGDGTIDFVGQRTGYGNIIILRHDGGYSTYYAHLSQFADIHAGQRVMQGQLIGYVGQTGWATGPHLHYELRFHDVPQNPLSAMLMEQVTLTGLARQQFLGYAGDVLNRISVLRSLDVASGSNPTWSDASGV